jgi:hypothetical protein
MHTTISLRPDILQKAEQALILTHFKKIEDFITFLIEEKLNDLAQRQNDPIYHLRGILKDKKGGTALFVHDKLAEIEKEYSL